MIQTIEHPRKEIAPLAVGLGWGNDGAIYQEKLDGVFSTREIGAGIITAELMPGGELIAWDCVKFDGVDVRHYGAETRAMMRDDICRAAGVRVVQSHYNGGELLQAVLARGGEGIVRKMPGATYFDAMQAAKRLATWVCRVARLDLATGGADIVDHITGESRGRVPLRNRAALCRVGSLVKVEGLELTAGGKIREPRPCKDTPASWLVQF